MTVQFTRTAEDCDNLLDGKYKAKIIDIEEYQGQYGRTICFEWLILEPSQYRNLTKKERFLIESEDQKELIRGQRRFNQFWSQLTNDKDGIIRDFTKVKDVEAIISIKSFLTPGPNGTRRSYVESRNLIQNITPTINTTSSPLISMPTTRQDLGLPSAPLQDDEVPF